MSFVYFLTIIVIVILVLKKLIIGTKKSIIDVKNLPVVKNSKIIDNLESIPFYKYNENNSITYKIFEPNIVIPHDTMFLIEYGEISIYHNDVFICKKTTKDFHFHSLDLYKKLNITIKTEKETKIAIFNHNLSHQFIINCCLKKKVFEVISEYLNLDYIFLEMELSNMSKYQIVKKNKIVLQKNDTYRYKQQTVIFVEHGEFDLKNDTKSYRLYPKNSFGYSNSLFSCYKNIFLTCLSDQGVIFECSYNSTSISLKNILDDLDLIDKKNKTDVITFMHYIDLCTDWRIFRIDDEISETNFYYINEGGLKNNTSRIKRLSDIILIKKHIIEHVLKFDVATYRTLFNYKHLESDSKIITIIPNDKSIDIKLFSKRLKNSINQKVLVLDKSNFIFSLDITEELRINEYLNKLNRQHNIILINIENNYSRIAKFLHEISDVVLVVGYDFSKQLQYFNDYNTKNVEYVKLYEKNPYIKKKSFNIKPNLKKDENLKQNKIEKVFNDKIKKRFHHVLSPNNTILFSTKDYDRLARFLQGKRIGLVLGGGGARGIAHVGIIQALEEEGIPIDIIGGCSMGAFVGALYCKECDNSIAFKETKKFSSKGSSILYFLLDLTYPLMSLFRGKFLNSIIKSAFKNALIENLWIDFFCISTNLYTNEEEIHSSGLIWKYLRASMGLCGYVPPVCDSTGFLVDGGYLNNLPVDIMLKKDVYKIIAVDVGSKNTNDYDEHDECLNGFVGLVHKLLGVRKYITMQEIQYRLAFLSSENKLKNINNDNVFLIRPKLEGIRTMDFNKFDEIVASGYAYGKKIIQEWKKTGVYEKYFNQKKTRLRRRYSV